MTEKKSAKTKEIKKEVKTPVKKISIDEEENYPRSLQCEKCGVIVSVYEECKCKACDLECCGKPMVELEPSLIGSVYRCNSCDLMVVIEEDCDCESHCDLVCCKKPMVLCKD